MTPAQILQKLLNTNRGASALILSGLALLAASAIAVTWIGQNPDALTLAATILGFAFLVTMITFIVRNPATRAVIGWVLTGAVVIALAGLVDSALRLSGRLPSPVCYVRMLWEHPGDCERRRFPPVPVVAMTNPGALWFAARSTAPERLRTVQDTRPAPYQNGPIFLQFGGQVTRDQAISLATRLAELGWPVQGGDKGGEQVASPPDATEIRYFDTGAATDALDLARALKALRPGTEVFVRDFSASGLIAKPGLLEIWLAR